MKQKFAETIGDSTFIMVSDTNSIIDKLALKDINYKGSRFKDNPHNFQGFHEILSLTKPSVIGEISEVFLQSGVNIVTTNTCRANRYFLKDYELEDITYELNYAAAKIVRDKVVKYNTIARTKPRYTVAYLAPIPHELEADYIKSVYSEQIKGLLAGKIDIIFLKNFDSEKTIDLALTALNEILIKRKKTQEIILTVSKPELKEWLLNEDYMKKYDKIDVGAVGIDNSQEDLYAELKEKSPYKIIACVAADEIEDFKIKYGEKKYFDIIALNSLSQHTLIRDYINIIGEH